MLKNDDLVGVNADYQNNANGSASSPLSYLSVKQTPLYMKAKDDLREGNLESALLTIESCLTTSLAQLSGDEFHTALAPLYYLYGTTLLYLVEENDALLPPPPPQDQQEEEDEEEGEQNHYSDGQVGEIQGDLQEQNQEQNMTEDVQVAWENLDLSRTILHRALDDILPDLMAKLPPSNNSKAETRKTNKGDSDDDLIIAEQVFDLGQIYLRLGDIQKANGDYVHAVEDYNMCKNIWIGLRNLIQKPENERKIAHCYYCIAEVLMMLANDADKQQQVTSGDAGLEEVLQSVASASAVASSSKSTQGEIDQHRKLSISNYLTCGQTFANVIALLCNEKVTVLDDDDDESKTKQIVAPSLVDIVQSASEKLQLLRSNVAYMNSSSKDDESTVAEIKEILDEIQEVIDSSISEAKVLREDVSQMKKNLSTASEQNDDTKNAFSTTTIGFGPAATSITSTVTDIPVLVAKKKKKTKDEDTAGNEPKRLKSS
mmetsp:Transcript_11562/g.16599  ORF Transcript_11562/g.16599 Transcript_11562/m.16599 type:complete len:487 (-) Transcript_11562:92-1552(-)